MIILTESIKRTLERIGQTIENDLNNGNYISIVFRKAP